jgi:inhibitor of cysteine peptidase
MHRSRVALISVVVLLIVVIVSGAIVLAPRFRSLRQGGISEILRRQDSGVTRFASEEEFREYLAAGESLGGTAVGIRSFGAPEMMLMESADSAAGFGVMNASDGVAKSTSPRVSETNVRTEGIDEPDIVKTDGDHIYFSRESSYVYRDRPMPAVDIFEEESVSGSGGAEDAMEDGVVESEAVLVPGSAPVRMPAPSRQPSESTDFFSVASDGSVSADGGIDRNGEMLLFGDVLVSFSTDGRRIYGYDISDRSAPREIWTVRLDDGSALLEARKSDDTLYLVERTYANTDIPCPIRPMTTATGAMEIACTDIYHPGIPAPVDSVFTAVSLDPETGEARRDVSFVGASGLSVVYMSAEHLYITYPESADPVTLMLGFFEENGELLSGTFLQNLKQLAGYDLGIEAKLAELSRILGNEFRYRDADERLRIENEMKNRMDDYRKKHLREQEGTGIVKIALDDLSVSANGSVPGSPLNDFSLDEYEGNLRIATTVGGRGSGYWVGGISLGEAESENDVYILDRKLDRRGQVQGLGLDERIYSARFIGDRGYVVTFRETDPFYVLDLSDPDEPEVTGELKIPGYSSYLHPLGEHRVLGIGKDGASVKLSLFDVSDPSDPREVSKYILDEYWSEAVSNHHAFLADTDHEVFFIPGSQGGYVFSYENDELSLATAVAASRVKRALYIGDVLHIVGEEAIVSYDENTWERVGELDASR